MPMNLKFIGFFGTKKPIKCKIVYSALSLLLFRPLYSKKNTFKLYTKVLLHNRETPGKLTWWWGWFQTSEMTTNGRSSLFRFLSGFFKIQPVFYQKTRKSDFRIQKYGNKIPLLFGVEVPTFVCSKVIQIFVLVHLTLYFSVR